MTAVRCDGLELRAGYKSLIKNFSCDIQFSHSVAVTGPNGLGKTTLLRTLSGVSKPYRGTVHLAGEPVWPPSDDSPAAGRACYLASQPALFLDHTVLANLEFYVRCHGVLWNVESALEALRNVGLAERKQQTVRTLSTGQKRRLSLAFLRLTQPKILFLDEPTNGLDTEGIRLCLHTLTELKERARSAIIVATHDPALISWCSLQLELQKWQP